MNNYYIAYGSNLNLYQMAYRCPKAKVMGTAIIKDYRLLFKGSKSGSYLTIEKAEGYQVPVGVWIVTDEDIKNLDRYEGFPSFYYKKEIEIEVKGIKSNKTYHKKAFVYIMHEEREIGIPSREYVRTCAEGYYDFGFDTDYLMEALKHSTEVK